MNSFYVHMVNKLVEMDKFPERHRLEKLIQDDIDNVNSDSY